MRHAIAILLLVLSTCLASSEGCRQGSQAVARGKSDQLRLHIQDWLQLTVYRDGRIVACYAGKEPDEWQMDETERAALWEAADRFFASKHSAEYFTRSRYFHKLDGVIGGDSLSIVFVKDESRPPFPADLSLVVTKMSGVCKW